MKPWSEWPGVWKTLAVIGLVFAALVAVSIVRNSRASGPAVAPAPVAKSPIDCLKAAGLNQVTTRGATTWRGFHGYPFFAVFVDKLPSRAEAADAVAQADLVIADQAGVYAVTGPSIDTDDGNAVSDVAACLGG